jgi:predicted ribosome quality control (RQC) complex YloA/Tae2 family protein
MKQFTIEGYQVSVGENAKENDDLFKSANQGHYWFHADKLPSAHVWLQTPNETPPTRSLIKYCCGLVKDHTKGAGGKLSVVYTIKKHLGKDKECKQGEVIVRKTLGKVLT